eukprot:8170990-Alexandrium_andersonii.AAC.1
MSASLVGSEMCIRDRRGKPALRAPARAARPHRCVLACGRALRSCRPTECSRAERTARQRISPNMRRARNAREISDGARANRLTQRDRTNNSTE